MADQDLAAALRQYVQEASQDALADLVRGVDRVVEEAGAAFMQRVDTTGSFLEHPYTRTPGSDRREDTGFMRKSAGDGTGRQVQVMSPQTGQYKAKVGFTDAERDYFLYQDEGWTHQSGREIEGMNALAAARMVLEAGLEGL